MIENVGSKKSESLEYMEQYQKCIPFFKKNYSTELGEFLDIATDYQWKIILLNSPNLLYDNDFFDKMSIKRQKKFDNTLNNLDKNEIIFILSHIEGNESDKNKLYICNHISNVKFLNLMLKYDKSSKFYANDIDVDKKFEILKAADNDTIRTTKLIYESLDSETKLEFINSLDYDELGCLDTINRIDMIDNEADSLNDKLVDNVQIIKDDNNEQENSDKQEYNLIDEELFNLLTIEEDSLEEDNEQENDRMYIRRLREYHLNNTSIKNFFINDKVYTFFANKFNLEEKNNFDDRVEQYYHLSREQRKNLIDEYTNIIIKVSNAKKNGEEIKTDVSICGLDGKEVEQIYNEYSKNLKLSKIRAKASFANIKRLSEMTILQRAIFDESIKYINFLLTTEDLEETSSILYNIKISGITNFEDMDIESQNKCLYEIENNLNFNSTYEILVNNVTNFVEDLVKKLQSQGKNIDLNSRCISNNTTLERFVMKMKNNTIPESCLSENYLHILSEIPQFNISQIYLSQFRKKISTVEQQEILSIGNKLNNNNINPNMEENSQKSI